MIEKYFFAPKTLQRLRSRAGHTLMASQPRSNSKAMPLRARFAIYAPQLISDASYSAEASP